MQTGFSQSGTWDVRGSREAHKASDSKVREEKVTKRTHSISRRNALRLTVAAAATAGVAKPGIIRMAFAQDKTPIKIGFPVPLSGIYGDYAKDQVNGAQLAISQFNAKGGILGRKVELLVRDDQLDVQVNSQVAKELCENDKVDFLSGALGESTILSMNEASRQYKKIFFGINQSGDIFTGKNFNKYTFLEAMTPYLSVTYLARYAKEKWNPKRVFTIGPDYQWGHNNKNQWRRRTEEWGGQIVGEIIYPFKNEKYQAFMQPILDAKPDLLAAANFGDEQVLFLKQAVAYGIQEKMPILLTLTGITPRIPAGDAAFKGVYGGTSFYWEIGKTIPTAKAFVDAFEKAYDHPPGDYGATAYSAIVNLLTATQKVGSIDNDAIVKAVEDLHYDNYKGKQWFRPCTHQSLQDFFILQSRPKPEGKWGYFEVVNTQHWNEKDERSCEELRGA
jgi:branched-chain amino acid transport system substrate-binding protein